ncbi:MAG: hypothetical protein RIT45_353 [Pseudomonadota bacterium]|jgi:hypothetical protein
MTPPRTSFGPDRLRAAAGRVARHAVQSLLPTVLGVLVSMTVVRRHGEAAWGAWVQVTLALQLGAHVVNWGQREQVMRTLARDDAPLGPTFRAHLGARARWLLPLVAVVVGGFGAATGWPLWLVGGGAVWLALRAVSLAFEPVVLHEQRFLRAAAVDALATLAMLGGVVGLGDASRATLIALACIGEAIRAAGLLGLFPEVRAGTSAPSGRNDDALLLRAGLPFFLLGATGMLGSRADLYCVSAMLDGAAVARYAVLINMLLWLQSIAGLLLLPFVRRIYRMEQDALLRLTMRFGALGLGVGLVGSLGVGALLRYGYAMPFDARTFAVAVVFVAQMFVQTPAIYALYKAGREGRVLRAATAGVVANVLGNLTLLPLLGVLGALLSSTLVGCALAAYYAHQARGLALQTPR